MPDSQESAEFKPNDISSNIHHLVESKYYENEEGILGFGQWFSQYLAKFFHTIDESRPHAVE